MKLILHVQLLLRHQDALEAGSPYPDSFYDALCFGGELYSVVMYAFYENILLMMQHIYLNKIFVLVSVLFSASM